MNTSQSRSETPRTSNRRPTEGRTHSIASSEHLADISVYTSCSILKVWNFNGLAMTVRLSSYLSGKYASLITLFASTNLCHECQLIVQKTIETTRVLLRNEISWSRNQWLEAESKEVLCKDSLSFASMRCTHIVVSSLCCYPLHTLPKTSGTESMSIYKMVSV